MDTSPYAVSLPRLFFSAFVAIPVFAYALYFLPIAFGVVRGLLSNDPSIMEDLRGDPGIAGVFFVPIVMAVIFLALRMHQVPETPRTIVRGWCSHLS